MRKVSRNLWLQMYAVEKLMSCIVGLMAYTLFVALLGVMVARQTSGLWGASEASRMLVKVLFSGEGQERHGRAAVETALRMRLESLQEVERYSFVVSERPSVVLAPDFLIEPIFVDVTVRPGSIDAATLQHVLQKTTPLAKVQNVDQGKKSSRSSRVTEVICFSLLVLTFFGSVSVIALASQAGLVANRKIISTMSLMGATPLYIVRQFQRQTLRLGGQGVLLSVTAMLVTFLVLYFLSVRGGFNFSCFCSLPVILGCCTAIPLFVMLFMLVATDVLVRQYLRQGVDVVDEWSI